MLNLRYQWVAQDAVLYRCPANLTLALRNWLAEQPVPVMGLICGVDSVLLRTQPNIEPPVPHDLTPVSASSGQLHRIEVYYGTEVGLDLERIASQTHLEVEEVIARHAAVEYRVQVIGFAPGFAYLSGLDPALECPRLDRPRTQVPAGSLALAGTQTAIYPRMSPGGWNLMGCVPAWRREAPSDDWCQMGDRIQFVPMTSEHYRQALHD